MKAVLKSTDREVVFVHGARNGKVDALRDRLKAFADTNRRLTSVLFYDYPLRSDIHRVVLENDRVRVLEYKSRPGLGVCGDGMHYHPAHVTVSLTGAKLKVMIPGGKTTLKEVPPGHAFFAEAETHSAEIIGGYDTRSYIIELKGKDWKPSTG